MALEYDVDLWGEKADLDFVYDVECVGISGIRKVDFHQSI
jgi:hypothetical protein